MGVSASTLTYKRPATKAGKRCPYLLTKVPTDTSTLRLQFFDYLFGSDEGYLCICTRKAHMRETFKQYFFNWPEQRGSVGTFVDQSVHRQDVWFCTSLLERSERKKEFCLPSDLIWADLDTCNPDIVEPRPTVVIQSSPNRYQAMWRLDRKIEPYMQESYAKRIAYKYNENGADPSGWDLTQLLRVPFTFNYKYEGTEAGDVPEVKLLRSFETKVPTGLFDALPAVRGKEDIEALPLPNLDDIPSVETIIYKYAPYLRKTAFNTLFLQEPTVEDDWSRILWRLINICIEAGMENEEVFAVVSEAKCNKYARDSRPPHHLWQDILRADAGQKKLTIITSSSKPLLIPELVKDADLSGNFIEEYKEWASIATDAIEQYHEVSAAILLSAALASGIRLGTTYGPVVPNLWALILGESTLTRKTTAMRMAMDIIVDIDPTVILASDGTAEGLLTGLSDRPYRTSIFYRDEVSGFVDSINKKDYLAGMPETLTQLYDVPRLYTRRLRKETITISSPVFIFFGGGIRDKVYSLLTDEYVFSGFIPRFIVVSGEADLTNIRRAGPDTTNTVEQRANLVEKLKYLYGIYNDSAIIEVMGQQAEINKEFKAVLTEEAWNTYGDMEEKMTEEAYHSEISGLALPTFDRMARNILKLAILFAASRQEPDGLTIHVEEKDVLQAAHYIQKWGIYTIDLLQNVGKSQPERRLEKVLRTIEQNPDIIRSKLMQMHTLYKREADEILGTLEDRGLITRVKEGKGTRYKAI